MPFLQCVQDLVTIVVETILAPGDQSVKCEGLTRGTRYIRDLAPVCPSLPDTGLSRVPNCLVAALWDGMPAQDVG